MPGYSVQAWQVCVPISMLVREISRRKTPNSKKLAHNMYSIRGIYFFTTLVMCGSYYCQL